VTAAHGGCLVAVCDADADAPGDGVHLVCGAHWHQAPGELREGLTWAFGMRDTTHRHRALRALLAYLDSEA
jgi:hypothetical protein